MIRVATYNIRKCVGLDWRRRPERIMRVLAELKADVVALQEADRRFGERFGTLPVGELHRHTGLRPVQLAGGGRRLGWHGNAILVGDEVEVEDCEAVDLPSFEPRGAVIAELRVREQPLRVVGTHLGLIPWDRLRQAHALVEAIDRRERRRKAFPTAIMGDLNEWSTREGCVAILAERYDPAPALPSFHSSAPMAALDRIFAGPGLTVEQEVVHRSADADRASDHLPVTACLVPAAEARQAAAAPKVAAEVVDA